MVGLSNPRRLHQAPEHARIFVRHHGRTGPFACEFCGEVVWLLTGDGTGVVHHRDEDRTNNAITNLTAAHRRCHGKHHHAEREFSDEHRERISAALKAKGIRPRGDFTGRGKGVPKSEAHRAAIAEGQRRRWEQRRG